jgi:hypothetical protein
VEAAFEAVPPERVAEILDGELAAERLQSERRSVAAREVAS